jgi:ribonuclease P protein component
MPGEARLQRAHRLRRAGEFTETMKSGRRSRDACFSIYTCRSPLPHAQLGVTVSRRVSPRAVTRNRIKRQIRESFRQHRHLLASVRVVVAAQPAAAASNNQQLRTSLHQHWQRIAGQKHQ